ncbi:MAG: peptide chain release factor N(5)-glutamine methyltransferase [Bacilli bacterium]|nr:peptide chain release factor N(5)-glutamine methyltransferase [Bacilli bacterium]
MKYRESDLEYLKKYIKEHNLDDAYYNKCLEELDKGRPIQYIIGEVNFFGYDITVNENVLIPRYETELLVDKAITRINKMFPGKCVNIIDLGTGSGCIAITLKKKLNCNVDALDISREALAVARENAKRNNALINFICDDMTTYTDNKYDVIISNPPYIAPGEEIQDIVKNNEPEIALYAEDNGLYFYEKIIENIPKITNGKYLVCLEIGNTQAKTIKMMAQRKLKNAYVYIEKDYSGQDRYVFIINLKN